MFDQFKRLSKETNSKTGYFALRKFGEIKQRMVEFAKPFHQAAWKQKM